MQPTPRWVRWILAAITASALLAGVTPSGDRGMGPRLAAAQGTAVGHTLLGATQTNLAAYEAAAGTILPLIRIYRNIGEDAIGEPEQRLLSSGHTLLLSIAPRMRDGTRISLSSIAAGSQDAYFAAQLDALNVLPTTPYFIFDHEPTNNEQSQACSTTARRCGPEFVAAWRHLHDLAQQREDTRLVWVWTMEGFTFRSDAAVASMFYPGADAVDALGVDVYPTGACDANGGAETFAGLTQSMLQWRQANAPALP